MGGSSESIWNSYNWSLHMYGRVGTVTKLHVSSPGDQNNVILALEKCVPMWLQFFESGGLHTIGSGEDVMHAHLYPAHGLL